jgi:uncharacterized caspase-like protein
MKHFAFCLPAKVLYCLLLFVSVAQAQTGTRPPTKWALLVGIDQYVNPDITPLRYAVADTKGMRNSLLKAGFPEGKVFTMTSDAQGPDYPSSLNVLKRLGTLSNYVQPGDTFLFYFSGHGYQRTENHFLGTIDADPTDDVTLEQSTLSMKSLRRQMSRIKARNAIFILDACRNDPYRGKSDVNNVLTDSFSRDLQLVAKSTAGGQSGSAVLLACSEGERAWEQPEINHGVFTYYLMEGLNGAAAEADGRITMTSLGDYVQQKVGNWALKNNKTQTPDLQQFGAAKIVVTQHAKTPVLNPLPSDVPPKREPLMPWSELEKLIVTDIMVNSSPEGARVIVDGKEIGKTPFIWKVRIDQAKTEPVKFETQLAGHFTDIRDITLTHRKDQKIEISLKSLDITPQPAPVVTPIVPTPIEEPSPLPTTQNEIRREISTLLQSAGNFKSSRTSGDNVEYQQSTTLIRGGYFHFRQGFDMKTAPRIPTVRVFFDFEIPFRARDIAQIKVDNSDPDDGNAQVVINTRNKVIKMTGRDKKTTLENEAFLGFATVKDAERFASLLRELLKFYP